ncbi:allophanate hydrolase subunit 1 [Microlunatus panaciterrae]|uniref:KipI family sensor histidine kinase inhibitor n=1 Tax=Microlunatus panaciterrae TaxID=400768 RepID=A0ABS2RL33_9ACTN|nr:allophanate hydrolase subunit 1 [Microlunatus panaciterrae]MBM7799723.1 KipI family sensor histidine kinase inhibitor [Microlunatus panaciterrae]
MAQPDRAPGHRRRLLPYGDSAALVECADLADALGLHATLRSRRCPEIVEIVPGARSLLLRLSGPLTPASQSLLLEAPAAAPAADPTEVVVIETSYDGEDLAEVARLSRMTPAAVVAAHTGQLWTVAFCGFAPGFAYLVGEHDRLRVPRRTTPRTRVPPGAVGLADHWSGVYPREGPGGWQLIGRTDLALWDLDRSPAALLQPGTRVRFSDRAGAP